MPKATELSGFLSRAVPLYIALKAIFPGVVVGGESCLLIEVLHILFSLGLEITNKNSWSSKAPSGAVMQQTWRRTVLMVGTT